MSQLSKQELRRSLLEQRASLTPTQWRTKSDRICHQLQAFPLYQQARTVLAYFSFRQEPDLSPLFNSHSDREKRWIFPRCVGKSLTWHLWQPEEQLVKSKYGTSEPLATAPAISASEADLILVPAVACDRQGYRLGYGGGFYDRLLTSAEWTNIPTIGIVFDFAYLTTLPIDSWDVKLYYVCTDKMPTTSTTDC